MIKSCDVIDPFFSQQGAFKHYLSGFSTKIKRITHNNNNFKLLKFYPSTLFKTYHKILIFLQVKVSVATFWGQSYTASLALGVCKREMLKMPKLPIVPL